MKGDIAVAGFMMTAEEWEGLDTVSRAQLVAVITRRDDPWIAQGSGPNVIEPDVPEELELELDESRRTELVPA